MRYGGRGWAIAGLVLATSRRLSASSQSLPSLPDTPLIADIAGYLLEMRDTQAYRPTTIARKLASLKTFFRYLRAVGNISVDPIEDLSSPRIQKDLPQVLSQEQVACLFRYVAVDTPAGIRDMAMLNMLYATGMRVSELMSLPRSVLSGDERVLTIRGKGGRERLVPLNSSARIGCS